MAQKIRKTLFIGLGGTGNLALKFAKKRFYEIYGEGIEPNKFDIPLVQFLALDTDKDDLEMGVGPNKKFGLKGADCLYMDVATPNVVLTNNPYIEDEWMPKENVDNLKNNRITDGAGQIRAFGRVGLMGNYQEIEKQVSAKIDELNNWQNNQNSAYEAMSGGINVVFCFSIAGGTGSGSFLDMSYIVRKAMRGADYTSQAYILLPEIFDKIIDEPLGKQRIWGNAYGALREIEFFMEGKSNMSDLELLHNIKIPVSGPPFDLIYLISDETKDGTKFDSKEHLMEVIGNNVAYKSGDLGIASKSSWDNIKRDVQMMNYLDEAKTKKPRYVSVGYAELKYDTDSVVDFASKKYASLLTDKIIDSNNRLSEDDMDHKVTQWKIKEHETDLLIDSIHSPSIGQKYVPEGDGYDGSNTKTYIETSAEAWLSGQTDTVKKDCTSALEQMIDVNSEESTISKIKKSFLGKGGILDVGGVQTALDAIEKLRGEPFISRYVFQMTDEIENNYNGTNTGLDNQIARTRKLITSNLSELADAQQSMFLTRKRNCLQFVEVLVSLYNKMLKLHMEKIRREAAKSFYATLSSELDVMQKSLSTFKDKIDDVKSTYMNSENEILSEVDTKNLKPFVKNIHNTKIKEISKSNSDMNLDRFIDSLDFPLSDLFTKNVDELTQDIDEFIEGTQNIKELKSTNLVTYLDDQEKDGNSEMLTALFKQLQSMASPISQFNEDAFKMQMGKLYTSKGLWGVPSIGGRADGIIKGEIDTNADTMETFDKTSVMFTTSDYPAPLYALKNLSYKYYKDYTDSTQSFSFDIDKRIRTEMDDLKFSLVPKDRTQEKAIFAWIFGLILNTIDEKEGIVRSGIGNYKIKSEKQGTIIEDFWCDLDSPWRHLAFANFEEKRFHLELIPVIRKRLDAMGGNAVSELISKIKDKDTYISDYSSLGRSWNALVQNPDGKDKDVLELMTLELEFLKDFTTESMSDFLD